jgi:TRAP-type C4-dicarboxylate transport system permease small subunit
MLHLLRKLTDHIEAAVLTAAMSIMTLAVLAQIVCRYVLNMPLDWSEEVARFTFIWCIYMGVSYACINRKHLKIDAALLLFPRSWRPWLEFIGKIFFLTFAIIIVYITWQHFYRITFVRLQLSPALQWPVGIAYSVLPLSFTMVIVRLLQDMHRFISRKEYLQTDILARLAQEELSSDEVAGAINTEHEKANIKKL